MSLVHKMGLYRQAPRAPWAIWSLGLVLLAICVAASTSMGAYQSLLAQWHEGGAQVFWYIRLPRVLMCVVAGVALGTAGALMQGLFGNPLADPGLVGVSSGAALGAATSLVMGWQWLGLPMGADSAAASSTPWMQMLAAFIGALLTTAATWLLARREGHLDVTRLLLVGIAINALAASGLGWLSFMANDTQLRSLTFWMLGSLGGSQWGPVLCCAAVVSVALGSLWLRPRCAQDLDALSLGEAQATLLGVPVQTVQRQCLVRVALAVGSVTALTGMVGFVGLLAPHAIRLLLGAEHRWVLRGSALAGACLVLLADAGARVLVAPAELPLGVLTGVLGACTFAWMLLRRSAMH
jgi:iron complex transport system permease protein